MDIAPIKYREVITTSVSHYNQATTKLAFHSNEISKDKLLII